MTIATLAVRDWGGIVVDAAGLEAVRGRAAGPDAVPVGLRRRMPKFALAAVRSAVGVAAPGGELVFASRYGDVTTALMLSETIVAAEPLSPSAFSACVHNAAPGLAAQVLGEKSSHTAVAAGDASLAAGLLEAWLRLSSGEAAEVVVLFAEQAMPGLYGEFDHEPGLPFVALAMRLGLGEGDGAPVGLGRAGAIALLSALEAGAAAVAVDPQFRAAA
ncbi:MAG TPA: beta-ketoacyl synthase chain length factor [Caulobacter sp.]|nr:beta-ketoacyl synthase chain length factor [Caulobacter sp.]